MSKVNVSGLPTPSQEQFVLAWMNPNVKSRKDVVNVLKGQGLHITTSSVYAREKSYRKAGINLRDLEKGKGKGRTLNVSALNELIAKGVETKTESV